MSIPMPQIPSSLLVPGQYQEIDNSLAGSSEDVKRVIVVSIMGPGGSAVAEKAVPVTSKAAARAALGAGSPADLICEEFLDLDTVEELFALPLSEDPAGTATVKKLAFTAVGAKSGTFVRYIGGKAVKIAVTAGELAPALAARFIAAVNAVLAMPVEASLNGAQTSEVLLTSLVKGEVGNHIDIVAGLYGEEDPEGVSVVVTTQTSGATNPTVAAALAALGGVRYHYFISDLVDAANLAAWAAALNDRYGAMRQIGGRLFAPLSGAAGDEATPGTILGQVAQVNCPHLVFIPRGQNPQTPGTWAGRMAAVAIRILADDPAANTLEAEVPGLIVTSPFDTDTRERFLSGGVATWKESPSGTVLIERLVTSYTEDAEGSRDTSYLDIQVVETIDAIRTTINSTAAKRFRTWKLSSTDENFGSGSKVMSPDLWKAFLLELYQAVFIQEKQWCQDFESYKASLVVEVASGSKARLNYKHQPVLIGQFLVGAGLTQFK